MTAVEIPRSNQTPGLYGPCPTCPECGGSFTHHSGSAFTLVGYLSPPGHDHDHNCECRMYTCASGHRTNLARVRRCPADGCKWRGKTSCFCCNRFVDEWPEAVPDPLSEEQRR